MEKKDSSLFKMRNVSAKAMMAWGLGLGGPVSSDPENPTLPC